MGDIDDKDGQDKDKDKTGDKDNKTGGKGSSDQTAAEKARAETLLKEQQDENARLKAELLKEKTDKEVLAKEKSDRETAELAEKGKYKELAEKTKKDADEAVSAADRRIISSEIKLALLTAGVTDPDIHVMIDRSTLKLSGDSVSGLSEAIEKFKKEKPHFFKATKEEEIKDADTEKDNKEEKKERKTGSGGTPPKGKDKGTGDIPDVRNMKPDEYREHRNKVIRDAGGFISRRAARR